MHQAVADVDDEFRIAGRLAESIGLGEIGKQGASFCDNAGSVYLDCEEECEGEKGDCGLNYHSN